MIYISIHSYQMNHRSSRKAWLYLIFYITCPFVVTAITPEQKKALMEEMETRCLNVQNSVCEQPKVLGAVVCSLVSGNKRLAYESFVPESVRCNYPSYTCWSDFVDRLGQSKLDELASQMAVGAGYYASSAASAWVEDVERKLRELKKDVAFQRPMKGMWGAVLALSLFPHRAPIVVKQGCHANQQNCEIVKKQLKNDSKQVKDLMREKEKARCMGIIGASPRVVDVFTPDGKDYFPNMYVMERVDGRTVSDWVEDLYQGFYRGIKHKSAREIELLSLSYGLRILNLQIAMAVALKELWRRGFWHCDNHNKNLMLKNAGSVEEVRAMAAVLAKEAGGAKWGFVEGQTFATATKGHTALLFPSQIVFIDAGFAERPYRDTVSCKRMKTSSMYKIKVDFGSYEDDEIEFPHGYIFARIDRLFGKIEEERTMHKYENELLYRIIGHLLNLRDEVEAAFKLYNGKKLVSAINEVAGNRDKVKRILQLHASHVKGSKPAIDKGLLSSRLSKLSSRLSSRPSLRRSPSALRSKSHLSES